MSNIKNIINKIYSNKRKFIFAIALIVFSGVTLVTAATTLLSADVTFNNSGTGLSSTNVKAAIDELYAKAKKCTTYNEVNGNCTNAAAPTITGGLIPVTIADNGTVTYANVKSTWYNYCEKKWANAVLLKSSPSKSYSVGNTILEADIDAYFVWIPKFKYKLWNVGTSSPTKFIHSIDVVFDTTNTTNTSTSCATPLTSGESGSCTNGKYMTHPAFITLGKNGFWVGKFILGNRTATGGTNGQSESTDTTKMIVKPNTYVMMNTRAGIFFSNAYNYKRSLDSHMIKNTEWGAISYLAYSKFGIDSKIATCYVQNNQNGCVSDFTPSSADNSRVEYKYPDAGAVIGSTTGNISGVYDMSTMNYQVVAGVNSGLSNNTLSGGGMAIADIQAYNSKYYDLYLNGTSGDYDFNYRILGDGIGEFGPFISWVDNNGTYYHNSWYYEPAIMPVGFNGWIARGGTIITTPGIASYLISMLTVGRTSGAKSSYLTTRVVLSP